MTGESYRRQLRCLLYLRYVFQALINPILCWHNNIDKSVQYSTNLTACCVLIFQTVFSTSGHFYITFLLFICHLAKESTLKTSTALYCLVKKEKRRKKCLWTFSISLVLWAINSHSFTPARLHPPGFDKLQFQLSPLIVLRGDEAVDFCPGRLHISLTLPLLFYQQVVLLAQLSAYVLVVCMDCTNTHRSAHFPGRQLGNTNDNNDG